MTFFKGTTGALTAGRLALTVLADVFFAAAALEAKFFFICALEGNASATPILAALERRKVVAGLAVSATAFLTMTFFKGTTGALMAGRSFEESHRQNKRSETSCQICSQACSKAGAGSQGIKRPCVW